MDLLVETSLQLRCVHELSDDHVLSDGSTCYPGRSCNVHLINVDDGNDDDLLNWLGDALRQLEDGEADLIQIMARRM